MKRMRLSRTLTAATFAVALAGTGTMAFAKQAVAPAAPQLDKETVEKIVHDYLLTHPEILMEMSNKLDAMQDVAEQRERDTALAKVGLKTLFNPKLAFVTGPENAKSTVVEFFDYRCVHCKASLPAMQKLVSANQKVRVAFIEHPILTQDSIVAATAAVAARRQTNKYVPFHFALMATSGDLPKERILGIAKSVGLNVAKLEKDMADPAIIQSVKQSNDLAKTLHFNGTPTFVINGKIVVGELTEAELLELAGVTKS